MTIRMLGIAMLLLLAAAPARAQRVNAELLGDIEAWKTDAGSRLLARNAGEWLAAAHLYGFGLIRLASTAELRLVAEAGGSTAAGDDPAVVVELLALRISPSPAFTLEGGRILMPVGAFGSRRFPNTNPLIGAPDLYPPQYPWGLVAAGVVRTFDYAVGAVSLPVVNPRYSPEPGHQLRPVLRAGYTPSPAVRFGAALTHGPYLGPSSAERLPVNADWHDFSQTVIASDLRFSIGYVDARAEIAWSSYEVPTIAENVRGLGAYAEIRVAHTPRIFSAARVERFRYPFIRALSATTWIGTPVTQYNAEAGLGYRLSRATLAKVSYRRDYWPGDVRPGSPPAPDGYALAVQFSMLVDLGELLETRY